METGAAAVNVIKELWADAPIKLRDLPGAPEGCDLVWVPAGGFKAMLQINAMCESVSELKVGFRLRRQGVILVTMSPNAKVARAIGAQLAKSPILHIFNTSARNQRFTLEVLDYSHPEFPTTQLLYLYVPTVASCETSYFSGDTLRCTPLPPELVSRPGSYYEVIAHRVEVQGSNSWLPSLFGPSLLGTAPGGSIAKGTIVRVTYKKGPDWKFTKVTGHGVDQGWVKGAALRQLQASAGLADGIQLVSQQAFAVEFEGVLRRPRIQDLPRELAGRWKTTGDNNVTMRLLREHFKGRGWRSGLSSLTGAGERKHYQKITEGVYFPVLQKCLKHVVGWTLREGRNCDSYTDCGLAGYCEASQDAESQGVCTDRSTCEDDGKGLSCPKPLKTWPWHFDSSVMPMSFKETKRKDEWDGVPVEIVAPGPPQWALRDKEGLHNIGEMLTVMTWMGAQMGPSTGMHVHVNVQSKKAGGACCLTDQQVARVWVAWAKYQLVLDEFQTPSRVSNQYAVPLLMGDQRIAAVFANLHDFVRGKIHHRKADSTPDFCNSALGVLRDPLSLRMEGVGGAWNNTQSGARFARDGKVCGKAHPSERYIALNLHPLNKMGTIEFRSHAGTHDIKRVFRWVQLTTAFVEAFKDNKAIDTYFDNEDITINWRELYFNQRDATASQFIEQLDVDSGFGEFYLKRQWVSGPQEPASTEGKAMCPMETAPTLNSLTVSPGYKASPMIELTTSLPPASLGK